MSKLICPALIVAACVLSFAVNAAERKSASVAGVIVSSDIFKPLPQPCPLGKSEQVIYDKSGRPIARVCV
ncbi:MULTISPECIES: hypothetical protein [unclassified Lysobacter]|uniref:hypothetical protein n=1 Tax=unclassified Lysobacter TaxID=2635362 RepID=UPI001BE5BFB7|nr:MULTISPECIES: hypothetical protein [unclassified Lysobacter]MBT2748552.1 hypothetical protein [Lysobacter sp. ISL-42]MBT2752917.1 hypothetical protein [Lysobacter sp. ISL-50]MBT2775986.1 hypothetical protein [Lysobacter sp. ISL-54]MBT2783751.1 hypothetical protein [Lysobacter sp. ISL-52]